MGGLGQLVLLIVGLYVGVALLNGIMFYLMSWAGNHVLRNLREEVFAHIHGCPWATSPRTRPAT